VGRDSSQRASPYGRFDFLSSTANHPRLSLEERYRGVDDYLQRIRSSAMDLIRRHDLLAEDLDSIVERAKEHWTFATQEADRRSADRR